MTAASAMAAATTTPNPGSALHPGGPVVVAVDARSPGAIDYAAEQGEYWARPDRWGSSSFASASMLAHQILVTCGPGRVLDVGCGMGRLVHDLLGHGVDAHGVDVAAKVVEHGDGIAPGRFTAASMLQLPFDDASFETVVCTHALEYLSEADVPRALAELARVARRNVFITTATHADRDDRWRRTVRGREWWEQKLIEAGLRKHPAAPGILPYESLESGGDATLVMEKIPAEAARAHPLETLRAGRGLHMDMLREAGRRADAHVARYALAAGFVRRGDTVIDAACGLGYGAAVVARMSAAAKVIGIDNDREAVEYARGNFTPTDTRCEFRQSDCQDLSAFADESVDMVVSFETLEHVPNPEGMVTEALRVLRPGGRFIASVPNEWVDESGRDPNPHHLHVYNWETLSRQILAAGSAGIRFAVERGYAQTAGSGMKLAGEPRRMTGVGVNENGELRDSPPPPAEWWVVVAMKVVDGGEGTLKNATTILSRGHGAEYHPMSFAREYENPWLGDIMVMIGHRMTDARALEVMARRSLEQARADSADAGAALCVLGYRLLESPSRTHSDVVALLDRIEAFDQQAGAAGDSSPHVLRWRISNRFVAGRLLMSLGEHAQARAMFLRCAELDPVPFSPLLASKTVESLYHAGVLALAAGDAAAARSDWERGLRETQRALSGDWSQIWDDPSRPAPFAMPEVGAVADAASMCAQGIIGLDEWADRPGRVWRAMHAGTKGDLRSWIAHLERGAAATKPASDAGADAASSAWLQDQLSNWRREAERHAGSIRDLKLWCQQLSEGKRWLESKLEEATQRASSFEESNAWLKQQVQNWRSESERRDSSLAELKNWTQQLESGKAWLQGQLDEARGRLADLETRTNDAESRAREAELDVGRRTCELGAQISQLKSARAEAEEQLRMSREHEAKLKLANKQYKEVLKALSTPTGLLKAIGRAIIGRPAKNWPRD